MSFANPITRGMGHLQLLISRGFGKSMEKLGVGRPWRKPLYRTAEYVIKIIVPVVRTAEQDYNIIAEICHSKLIEVLDAI